MTQEPLLRLLGEDASAPDVGLPMAGPGLCDLCREPWCGIGTARACARARRHTELRSVELRPEPAAEPRALRLKPLKPINHFTAVEKSMNLGRKGANKAQERAQTLAHGHPWGLGRSLTVILLSLLHVGSHGVEAFKGLTPRASSCR